MGNVEEGRLEQNAHCIVSEAEPHMWRADVTIMTDIMTDICQQVDGKSVSLVITSPSRTAAATAAAAAVRQRGDCGRGTSAHVFAPRLSAPAPSQTEGVLLSEKWFFFVKRVMVG